MRLDLSLLRTVAEVHWPGVVLEAKYAKPRGKAAFGEWYAFRESLEPLTRRLTFYANHCRRGVYSIAYTDDRTQWGGPQPASDPKTP